MRSQYETLARYNSWMNSKIYSAASQLEEEERRSDRGAFFGSIHMTLTHILITDRAWLARLGIDRMVLSFQDPSGTPIRVTSGQQDVYPDFSDLYSARQQTDSTIEAMVLSETEDSIFEIMSYHDSAGDPCSHPRWWALTHLFNHQTHHRGQVTTLFSQLGVDPGVTDYLMYLRDAP